MALAWWRCTLADRCAYRMARHLTHHADKAGHITNLPKVVGLYASQHKVGRRTAWTDLGRLVGLGMLRKTLGAAPGQRAEYVLCWDLARLPGGFPKSLGRAVETVTDNPKRLAMRRPTLASIHRALASCVTVRYGSRTCSTPIRSRGCGLVHTSPYTYEGSTPPPTESGLDEPPGCDRRRSEGDKTLAERMDEARELLERCRAMWVMQRAGQVPEGTEVPSKSGMASLEHLVELLLRHLPPGEVEELLSAQVRSARSMVGLVQWRAGRLLRGIRRRQQIRVDDAGVRHAAWMAEQAARWEGQYAGSENRRRAIAEARRVQERHGTSTVVARGRRADTAAAVARWAAEPEVGFARVVQELEPGVDETARAREEARRRAVARARLEREAKTLERQRMLTAVPLTDDERAAVDDGQAALDRQALAELINQCVQEETDPERHLAAWETPETLGLLA
ncbi:hypothetical protein [Streptosporangium sp. CA-115845]|uniref:hypothetical protein n=1 Tax=Streptosporangium sp. CA-115845 TaxID=3240071 RepID=UPI003D8D554D